VRGNPKLSSSPDLIWRSSLVAVEKDARIKSGHDESGDADLGATAEKDARIKSGHDESGDADLGPLCDPNAKLSSSPDLIRRSSLVAAEKDARIKSGHNERWGCGFVGCGGKGCPDQVRA
jgi:hypothetical protein